MFWNVTFIYNAFIRTTDHCKVQIAFVSCFIFLLRWNRETHQIQPYTRAFNEFLYEFLRIFLISENSLKFANFFGWANEFSIYAFIEPIGLTCPFSWRYMLISDSVYLRGDQMTSLAIFRRRPGVLRAHESSLCMFWPWSTLVRLQHCRLYDYYKRHY